MKMKKRVEKLTKEQFEALVEQMHTSSIVTLKRQPLPVSGSETQNHAAQLRALKVAC